MGGADASIGMVRPRLLAEVRIRLGTGRGPRVTKRVAALGGSPEGAWLSPGHVLRVGSPRRPMLVETIEELLGAVVPRSLRPGLEPRAT